MQVHVIHMGGPYHGQLVTLHFPHQPPTEIRYPKMLNPGDLVEEEDDPRTTKIPCHIYRLVNVEKADKPMRGLMGEARYLRQSEALPGLIYSE